MFLVVVLDSKLKAHHPNSKHDLAAGALLPFPNQSLKNTSANYCPFKNGIYVEFCLSFGECSLAVSWDSCEKKQECLQELYT